MNASNATTIAISICYAKNTRGANAKTSNNSSLFLSFPVYPGAPPAPTSFEQRLYCCRKTRKRTTCSENVEQIQLFYVTFWTPQKPSTHHGPQEAHTARASLATPTTTTTTANAPAQAAARNTTGASTNTSTTAAPISTLLQQRQHQHNQQRHHSLSEPMFAS